MVPHPELRKADRAAAVRVHLSEDLVHASDLGEEAKTRAGPYKEHV